LPNSCPGTGNRSKPPAPPPKPARSPSAYFTSSKSRPAAVETLGIPYETLWTADFRSRESRVPAGEPYRSCFKSRRLPDCRSTRTGPEACLGRSLPIAWPSFQAAFHRWIGAEVLLYRTPATVLDRGAPLDDAAIEAGLLSVDCLKSSHASVHAG
jgi:hypothetical protein